METYLSGIVASHRQAAALDSRSLNDVVNLAVSSRPPRGFAARISAHEGLALIAEVKRASPSLGPLVPHLDPAELAVAYKDGGASCCSVLTDQQFFHGSFEDLQVVQATVDLPVLRKDFTVSALDVADARCMGADAVLLIAAVLSDEELSSFARLAHDLDLDVLVEVHDERELERALQLDVAMIGVNQRDLVTFTIDTERAVRLAASIPTSVLAVAESGIRGADDAVSMANAGFSAILVGEILVKASDRVAATRALVGAPIRRQVDAR
ncbi:MAG: indole-3-glycerol phosphate synthase TrpC [Actinomycetota bacterium]